MNRNRRVKEKKMDDIYKCKNENCEGDGKRMGELFLECYRCEKKHYLQCIIFDEEDVLGMVTAIKLIKRDERTKAFETNITSETIENFNTIIGDNTSFKYICKKCLKTEGKTIEMLETIKTLKKKLNKMENELKTVKDKLENEKQNNMELNENLKTKVKLIEEMTDRMDEPQTLEDREERERDNNVNTEQTETERKISALIKKQMEKEVEKMKQACTETIVNECKKMKEEMTKKRGNDTIINTSTGDDIFGGEKNKENEKTVATEKDREH